MLNDYLQRARYTEKESGKIKSVTRPIRMFNDDIFEQNRSILSSPSSSLLEDQSFTESASSNANIYTSLQNDSLSSLNEMLVFSIFILY